MIDILFKKQAVLACFVALAASTLSLDLHATDDLENQIPRIAATWVPHFDLGYITLSIKNLENIPIKVSPTLQDTFPPNNADVGCFYAYPVFVKDTQAHINYSVDDINSMRATSGQRPRPVEIAPGETKLVKFLIPKFLIKIAMASGQIKFSLGHDTTVVQSAILRNIDNIWKEQ